MAQPLSVLSEFSATRFTRPEAICTRRAIHYAGPLFKSATTRLQISLPCPSTFRFTAVPLSHLGFSIGTRSSRFLPSASSRFYRNQRKNSTAPSINRFFHRVIRSFLLSIPLFIAPPVAFRENQGVFRGEPANFSHPSRAIYASGGWCNRSRQLRLYQARGRHGNRRDLKRHPRPRILISASTANYWRLRFEFAR